MKYADLHVHTHYSDSTFSPEEVMNTARLEGFAGIAICDHDTVDGVEPCRKIGEKLGIEVIPGIELTVELPDAEAHLLGYFLDHTLDWLKKRLKDVQDGRVDRIYKMAQKLEEAGVAIDPGDVLKLSGRGSVGRLHVAQALLSAKKVRTIKEAFEKYIKFGGPCYVPNNKFNPQEAISLIRRAGGVPVIAHPDIMGRDEYIEKFIEYGLRGIEVYHVEHKNHVVQRYEEFAKRRGLLITGGSDCHGYNKGRVLMGSIKVPYTIVEDLREESKKIRANG